MKPASVRLCGVLLLCAHVLSMEGKTISSKVVDTDDDVYMMPGMYHGLSNQRMCIANAIGTAIKKRWRLVLPDLRFNYPEVNILFTEPFDFFFDISALQSLSSYGLSIAHTLPRSKQRTCLWQLQHSLDSAIFPSIETVDAWADLHQVVCLHDQRTIDTIWQHQFMDNNLKQQIRKALRPSLQFREELRGVFDKMQEVMGTLNFVGLHVRVESDWDEYCRGEAFKDTICYVGEDGYLDFLKHRLKVKPGSPIYLASGAQINKLPQICSTYQCYVRNDFWSSSASRIAHANDLLVEAYMDFLMIQHASSFIGNRLSTFSMELFHLFQDENKDASFVNELQCPVGQKIMFGCQPAYILSCCV